MKPAPFEYVAARSVEEALAALDGDALPLAGGQSLLPLLNARRLRPRRLVDLNHAGLDTVEITAGGAEALGADAAPVAADGAAVGSEPPGGALRLGATVRQAALLRAPVADGWPLLAQAACRVGHLATRSRGTVGGSVAHADPRAQLPAALAALDARYEWAGPLLVAIEVPPLPPGARTAWAEHALTRASFPAAGAAVVLAPGHAAVALLGAGRVPEAEQALLAGAGAREAAELAARAVGGDHARALAADVTYRALVQAGRP